MNIKQVAETSGVSARNIRYYEQAGLLTPARNPENEYRIYSQADVRALKLIRMLHTLDMPVEEIGTVLNGTLPLAEAAERQRQRLEAEQQKLAAAAEHKRQFTFTPDTAIATPQEFTAELLAWAAGCGEEIVITHEGMTPRFMLDGIEYRAVRYSSHVRNIPILRVRCEVCDPAALKTDVEPRRLRRQKFVHEALPAAVLIVAAVAWVITWDVPVWPDKTVMCIAAAAIGVAGTVRAWWLYWNDKDE